MKKSDFLFLLLGVSYATYKYSKQHVNKNIVADFKYDVYLNMSFDTNNEEFMTYPEDNNKSYKDITDKEVIELLCRNNKIPVWIDISVGNKNDNFTVLKLICAGRYSDQSSDYYYNDRGTGPFAIKF